MLKSTPKGFGLSFILLHMVPPLWACPMCKEAVKASGDGGAPGAVAGFQWSIVSMLTMPYVIIGTVVGLLYHSYRKKQSKHT